VSNPLLDPQVDATLQNVLLLIVPEAILVFTACVLFLYGTMRPSRRGSVLIALLGLVAANVALWMVPEPDRLISTVAPLIGDSLAFFVRQLSLFTGFVFVLISTKEGDDRHSPDYLACLLVAIAGVSLTGAANDLVTIFLSLEMISIPTYILLYLPRQEKSSQEAAVKYFLLSILSSGLLLFGFSYLYGVTGVTNLSAITKILPRLASSDLSILVLVASIMVIAGIGFRITAVPFHFYAPDVYQGGPTGMAAFLSFVPKIAGFILLLRIFALITGVFPNSNQVTILLWSLAAITMTFGNVLALLQDNLKRMLAYSSVAHSGYMLMGIAVAANPGVQASNTVLMHGSEAILFYLVAYGAMTVGVFAALMYLNTPERSVESIDDLAGLGQSNGPTAFMMAIFLFSLIGLPLTAGFAGKFLLFTSALAVPTTAPMHTLYVVLVVIAALNAAIAAYYYLRVLGVMFLRTPFNPPKPIHSAYPYTAMVFCAVITVLFGIYPWPLLELSKNALGIP